MEQLLLFKDFAPVLSTPSGRNGGDNEVGRVKAALEAAWDYLSLVQSLIQSGIPFPVYKDVVSPALTQRPPTLVAVSQRRSIKEIRKTHPNAYRPWSKADEERAKAMHRDGCSLDEIAADLGRQPGAITAKLNEVKRCEERWLLYRVGY